MVDVLLDALRLKWVLEDELDENVRANSPGIPRNICDHHLLNSLHEVVEVGTEELAVDDLLEALEDVSL